MSTQYKTTCGCDLREHKDIPGIFVRVNTCAQHSLSSAPTSWFECDNCNFTTTLEEDLRPIKDVFQRVAPGEKMPAGECPECGCLVHLKHKKQVADTCGEPITQRVTGQRVIMYAPASINEARRIIQDLMIKRDPVVYQLALDLQRVINMGHPSKGKV